MMAHRYIPRLRPASFCTLPEGLKWRFVEAPQGEHWSSFGDMPISRHRYGVIETDRELTPAELEHFDLGAA